VKISAKKLNYGTGRCWRELIFSSPHGEYVDPNAVSLWRGIQWKRTRFIKPKLSNKYGP
jgi:hypothetical protein